MMTTMVRQAVIVIESRSKAMAAGVRFEPTLSKAQTRTDVQATRVSIVLTFHSGAKIVDGRRRSLGGFEVRDWSTRCRGSTVDSILYAIRFS